MNCRPSDIRPRRCLWTSAAVLAAFFAALHAFVGPAHAEGITRRIKITTTGTLQLSRSVVRGDRDTYVLQIIGAKTMAVSLTSKENNAVFEVTGPDGKSLPCKEGVECRQWSNDVSAGGQYRIVVGGTRGNASYTIRIVVR